MTLKDSIIFREKKVRDPASRHQSPPSSPRRDQRRPRPPLRDRRLRLRAPRRCFQALKPYLLNEPSLHSFSMRRLNASKSPSSGSGEDKMEHIKLQSRSPGRSSNLFHRNPRLQPKFKLCIISSLSVALTFVLCYLFLFPRSISSSARKRYAIVIDGGSTGTRIHVFRYDLLEKNPLFDFGEEGLASMKVNPGLSAYAEDLVGAGESIRELIEFGKQRVPREYWSETEIRLMATAGMRLLELRIQYQILESCRRVLKQSSFEFRDEWASVITGSDEGMYAWVVANYALDTLGSDPQQTTGIIELGGASAQVTFSSSESLPSEFSRIVKFRNTTYNLYSNSFLHFGQNVAFEALRESLVSGDNDTASKYFEQGVLTDPCTPKGYSYLEHRKPSSVSFVDNSSYVSSIRTQGNFSECRSAALKMLQRGKDQCTHHHCYIGSTFTPKLQGKFMATENFFYTSMFFGLAERAPISDFISAGEQFCEEDWSVLKKRHSSIHEEDLLHYCFSSAYIVAILHDTLGIPLNDESIVFANQVGSIPLDWALGAFIIQSTITPTTMEKYEENSLSDWIGTTFVADSPILLLVAFILLTCIFVAWYLLRSGKTQFKTIYDLEKGRYIVVTRVNR